MTAIRSAFCTVLSLCAITNTVRPFPTRSNASWTNRSDSASKALKKFDDQCPIKNQSIPRCFVQNQNGRILQKRPSDCDSLFLSTRQRHPAFAHDRLVTVRKAGHEIVRIGQLGSFENLKRGNLGKYGLFTPYLLVSRVWFPVTNILHNAGMEKHRLLKIDYE